MISVQVQNIVGTGSLGVEVDLDAIVEDLDVVESQYDPGYYPGAYLRLTDAGPLITLYRTGKYNITGAHSEDELRLTQTEFLKRLVGIGLIDETVDDGFSISNVVATADLGENINLNALAVGLGLEAVEYEPEQFPGLIYRPSNLRCVLLIFGSGKVVITGGQTISEVERAFTAARDRIKSVLSV